MPGWLPMIIIALILFAIGSSTKSWAIKSIWWLFGIVVAMGAIPYALQDPAVQIALVAIGLIAIALVILKARKAAKKNQRDEQRNATHIHFYNRQ